MRLDQLDAKRILAGWGLDAQGEYRVRQVGRFVEELVGNPGVDVANRRILIYVALGCDVRTAVVATTGLVSRGAIDHGHVQVELPAVVVVVAAGEIQCVSVSLDPVQVDVAQKDRVQCEEAVECQLASVVVGIRQTRLETELAAAEEAAGLVIQVGHTLRRLRIVCQRLSVDAPLPPAAPPDAAAAPVPVAATD